MTRERTETWGEPVTVEGRDRSPRGAWRWAIAAALVPLVLGLASLVYSARGSSRFDASSSLARAGLWVTVVSAAALAVVATAEYLINWNRRDAFHLHAARNGLAYRVVSAREPKQSRRWPPEQIVDVSDTSRGLRLTLRGGEKVDLPLARSSDDSRKLADEVMAAMGVAREGTK